MTVNTGRFLIHSERTEGTCTHSQKDLSVLMQAVDTYKRFGTYSEICQCDLFWRYLDLNPGGLADNLTAGPQMEKCSDIILVFCVIIQRSICAEDLPAWPIPAKSGPLDSNT